MSGPPVLVAVAYEEASQVWLTFDRDINIDAIVVEAVAVADAVQANGRYLGTTNAVLTDPRTVEITLLYLDDTVGTGIRLSVAANNGITSATDATPWAGVSDVEIPFG